MNNLEKETRSEKVSSLLNQILVDCTLSPEELPLPKENCIYHTSRSLFKIRSKRSSKENQIFRFTIAKKVYEYLNEGEKYDIRIEFNPSLTKIIFHVSYVKLEYETKYQEPRTLISNSDGSVRVNIPP